MATMNEQWRPVVGFEDQYEVSDHGRVRSLDRVVAISNTHSKSGKRTYAGKLLKLTTTKTAPRPLVGLTRDGKLATRQVHALVLEAFVGPCPPGMIGLHYDDEPTNNHVSNLRWGTRRENQLDAVRNGRNVNANKTHCKRGHEFKPETTRMESVRNGASLVRRCTLCVKERTP